MAGVRTSILALHLVIFSKQYMGTSSMKERNTLWWCDEPGIRKESSPPTGLGLLMSKCYAFLPTITSLQLNNSWWLNIVSLSASDWQKCSWFTQIPCEQKQLGFSHLQWRLDGGGAALLVSVKNSSGPSDALESIILDWPPELWITFHPLTWSSHSGLVKTESYLYMNKSIVYCQGLKPILAVE